MTFLRSKFKKKSVRGNILGTNVLKTWTRKMANEKNESIMEWWAVLMHKPKKE